MINIFPLKFYVIASFINFITPFALGFILLKNFRSKPSRLFSFFSFSVAGWAFTYCLWLLSADKAWAEFYLRTCMIGVILMPSLFIHFVSEFINKPKSVKFYAFNYILSILFALTVYTSLYARDPEKFLIFPYWLHTGPVFHLVITHFAIIVSYSLWLMLKELKTAKGIFRNQLLYMLAGTTIGYIGGSTNYFCWYRIPIPPFLNALVAVYVGFVGYAVIRYKLLDIHFVIRKSAANIILTVALSAVISTVSIYACPTWVKIFLFLLISSLTIAFLPKLKIRIENTVNQIFYKDKYKYQEALEAFIDKMVLIPKEEDLLKDTIKTLTETLGIKKTAVFIYDHVIDNYQMRAQTGLDGLMDLQQIPGSAGMAVWLKAHKEIFIKEEMKDIMSREEFTSAEKILSRLSAVVCVPAMLGPDLMGIITLGEKSTGEMYTHIDLEILRRLGTQLAVAVDYHRIRMQLQKEHELSGIGIMTAEIAHEMSNLLVSPSTFIELAPERRNDDDFFKEFRGMADQQMHKLAAKLEDIRFFGRFKNLNYTLVDLNALLTNVLQKYESKPAGIAIVKELSSIPKLRCDRDQIFQVFDNLILNSIEAMEKKPGGKLRIQTRIYDNPMPDMFLLADQWLRSEIKDDGTGIHPEIMKRLFTPFVTTKSVGGIKEKGSGLGLPSAKRIVDSHRGRIDIRSSAGKGTTVVVDLPVQLKEEPKPPEDADFLAVPPWLKNPQE